MGTKATWCGVATGLSGVCVCVQSNPPYVTHISIHNLIHSSDTPSHLSLLSVLSLLHLLPPKNQVRAMIKTMDRPSGPNGCVPPNGKLEFSEFRDFMLLANPTGRFTDWSVLADGWLEYVADEIGGPSGMDVGTASEKVGGGKKDGPPVWTSAVAGAIGNAFSRTAIAPLERTRMQVRTTCEDGD